MLKKLSQYSCKNLTRLYFSKVKIFLAVISILACHISWADNPIVSHVYTADPAARVFNDRVYVVTSHDQDNATDYSTLVDYYLFSSDDMINWQDHGVIFAAKKDTKWASLAFAPDFIERNGKYYLFFPDGANSIGVLVADKPEGPYKDLIGKPLIDKNTPNADVQWLFDPGVLLDDDGKVYVYFGGGGPGNARVVELNDSLTATVGSAITIDAPNFFEAPYVHKNNGLYYFSYSADQTKGFSIDYMTSDKPMSGFKYRGTVIANPWDNLGNNNHQSFIQYKGQWYAFYHNRSVSHSVYQRSINVDLLTYAKDGSMNAVNVGQLGVPKLKNINPYNKIEAETIDKQSGIKTEYSNDGGIHVLFKSGNWVRISNVDFSQGASLFEARVAAGDSSKIDVILDDINSSPVATLNVLSTGGLHKWNTQTVALKNISGLHDVYVRAHGRLNINWYQFQAKK